MLNGKIAVFLPSLNGGGAERVMVTLANAFTQRGYSVDLVLASVRGEYVQNVVPAVRLVDLKAGRIIKALLPLIHYLRREHPAAMLAAMTHTNVVALIAQALANVQSRLVISERTTISAELNRELDFTSRVVYRIFPRLYRRANRIIAVSKAAAADLIHSAAIPPSLVEVIYNPFDLQKIQQQAAESLNHLWFEPGQPPVILAIGRLNEAKDYPVLIRAFVKMKASRPLRLMILGEGELRKSLESQIEDAGLTADDVQMPGFVANPFAYLARCGVFVLSSRWEGLPGVLIEALACSAPVVSTDCPSGPQEILEGGRWGRLVPPGDTTALAEAVLTTLDTPRHLLPDGRSRAADFGLDQAVDAYLEALGLPAGVMGKAFP